MRYKLYSNECIVYNLMYFQVTSTISDFYRGVQKFDEPNLTEQPGQLLKKIPIIFSCFLYCMHIIINLLLSINTPINT